MSFPYVVNGKVGLAGFWRIDNALEDREGIDFLLAPAALVRGPFPLAVRVCEVMNEWHRAGQVMREEAADE